MASILDKYGIKEVADVTFYAIKDDGTKGAPVLFLDTLKVSTIEQTAEQAEARGGKGNPPLIIWDYGKEINVTLEDALFSAKSMSIMFGDSDGSKEFADDSTIIYKTLEFVGDSKPTSWTLPTGAVYAIAESETYDAMGNATSTFEEGKRYFITFPVKTSGMEIEISANSFPGTYYVTGDTYARSSITGKDEFFQFIIQKAKVVSENTITLEAEGDPSVFNMSLRVLRPEDGKMMKLVKYDVVTESTASVSD